MIRRHILLGIVLASALSLSLAAAGARAFPPSRVLRAEASFEGQHARQETHMACAEVKSLQLPDVKITEATPVAAATTGAIRAAHCRIAGVIGTEIRILVLLPDAWNQKFMMGGGGGYVGTVQNQASTSVNAGYATAGTDTGHQGGLTEATWAVDNPERFVNFGYLAIHRTSEVAKAIVRSYYGSPSTRAYFSGCSNGGRQALMEAQRFPDDFEGIVAGAPALDFVGIAAQFIKDIQAAFPGEASAPMFSPAVLKGVEAQIVEKCDALDGVKDGLMEDPRRCKIDVASLTGLSDAQRTALGKVYAETPGKDGAIYPAQPFGGEGETAGWPSWITGGGQSTPQGPSLRYAFGTQFFKFFVFNDPSWDFHKYDVTNARTDARLAGTVLNATNPDLSAYKAKGHKLIMWHGWSDPALTALGSIKYYDEVRERDQNAREYFRFFLMPGVLHCGGGSGPDNVDWSAAIADWVENGKSPDRIIARKVGSDGTAMRTRPLCPYPQHVVYNGSGSIDDAASFKCGER
jgi:tannase/feruloyl esterase